MDDPWSFRLLPPGRWLEWRLDGAQVWLWNLGDQWRWNTVDRRPEAIVADFSGPTAVDRPLDPGDRLVVLGRRPVALRPLTLDRPFVTVPPVVVEIHPGESLSFEFDLPVSYHWVTNDGQTVGRPNTIRLTKTWFGDVSAGEACFLWPSALAPREGGPYWSLARCPVTVINSGRGTLVLKKFVIYTRLLGLWTTGPGLVTDEVRLEGLADGTLRMDTVAGGPPGAKRLQAPPVGHTELLIQRGVGFLRNVAGIG